MSGPLLVALLVGAVAFVIVATARLKIHPFLVLLAASYGVGLLSGLSAAETVEAITGGFGGTIGYIGIVIAAGTIIGAVLEQTGGAQRLAESMLRLVGRARAVAAMITTGAVVSIPVFCDSGFIILSPLNRSLAEKSGESMATHAIALSLGLYTTHVFVPPTPGPIAAAAELNAELGLVIIFGLIVSVPVLVASYFFARWMGRRVSLPPSDAAVTRPSTDMPAGEQASRHAGGSRSSVTAAFLPIGMPVVLIALRSVANLPTRPFGDGSLRSLLDFLGDPNTALLLGAAAALIGSRELLRTVDSDWLGAALKQAGVIILITGAGGAFGRTLQASPIGAYLGELIGAADLGVFTIVIPFLLAASLKTALGSSTVAIITSASILFPMLPYMGLAGTWGAVLTTLAVGAGGMTVSHANDSYFWVVSQFSGMTVSQAYRLQTVGSAVAGVTGILTILVLALILL